MKTVSLKSKIGPDGCLHVNIPTEIKEKNVDILVIYDVSNDSNVLEVPDWPENYFTETYGCLSSDPIKRHSQGK